MHSKFFMLCKVILDVRLHPKMRIEKIGVVSLYEVRYSGRKHYIKLDRKTVTAYNIKIGDVLKVELKEKLTSQEEETA